MNNAILKIKVRAIYI